MAGDLFGNRRGITPQRIRSGSKKVYRVVTTKTAKLGAPTPAVIQKRKECKTADKEKRR